MMTTWECFKRTYEHKEADRVCRLLTAPGAAPYAAGSARVCCFLPGLQIINRKKLPIVVGGTGLFISSLIDNVKFSEGESDNTHQT